MAQETSRERHDRLESEHHKAVAGFVYGGPAPVTRFTFDKFGRKVYDSYEDYLNG